MGRQITSRMNDVIQEEVSIGTYYDIQTQEAVQRIWNQEEDGQDQQVSSIQIIDNARIRQDRNERRRSICIALRLSYCDG